MAYTLQYVIKQNEIDENSNLVNTEEFSYVVSYDSFNKQEFTIASGNTWHDINFGQVSESVSVKIETDYALTVKMNGSSTEINISDGAILMGALTTLSVKNNSGSTATIKIQIYG